MSESRTTRQTTVSRASTPQEIAEYWDSHSLDEGWEEGHGVSFELRAQRRRRVMLLSRDARPASKGGTNSRYRDRDPGGSLGGFSQHRRSECEESQASAASS